MEGLTITPNLLLFGGIATLAAICAVGVVAFQSAVRSALCLVLNFFLLAILYFTLGAETLGILQVVVYTGAIMVLFLFVIMLLNLGGAQRVLHEKIDPKMIVAPVLGLGLFSIVALQLFIPLQHIAEPAAPAGYGAPEPVGYALFAGFTWPFELASFLLLIGIVGSILLAKRKI